MSRSVRQLLSATWCRWGSVTSLLLSANRGVVLTVARQRRPASWTRPSVRLFHRAGRPCCDVPTLLGAVVPNDDESYSAITAESLVSDGSEGALESTDEDGNSLAGLDLGKTYIPPASTNNLVFGGIPYYQLPVIHIKATYNNTHVNITDHTGQKSYTRTTCGAEGFKNAKKGTTIAAQTVGIAAATKALDKGLKTVRVVVKGIGPGRQASIKGLQMGGLDIVSITDNTPIPHNGNRPRKARRL